MLSWEEVGKHASRHSCWVVIHGKAYDVTEFLDSHPGGAKSILKYAGKDGTEEYDLIHRAGTIEKALSSAQQLGPVETAISPSAILAAEQAARDDFYKVSSKEPKFIQDDKPLPLSFCMNLDDIENAAKRVISKRAWAYFHSAADSLQSYNTNLDDWKKVSFRPRVLVNVARVDMRRTIMGFKSNLPFFIAPAAMASLGHEDGELCNAAGAAIYNIPYCTSTFTSVSHEELAECIASKKRGCLFYQLYASKINSQTVELITTARELGFKALVVTVDTPVIGKREEDELHKAELDYEDGEVLPPPTEIPVESGSESDDSPILRGVTSSTLSWEDLIWIREAWGNCGPIVLKGIQTAEDAKRAADAGIEAIYLSNHGGRQLDHAPSSIRTLLEIRKFCPEILGKVEIYLDGGVRRGTDVLKALCLGATAVGLGRPFMYALGAYGTEGVAQAIKILSEEIETSMRLLGVTSLDQLNPDLVNTTLLARDLPSELAAFQHFRSKL